MTDSFSMPLSSAGDTTFADESTSKGAFNLRPENRFQRFQCFDFEVYVDPDDLISWPIVNHAVYEHHIMPVFREVVRPGMHVLDIGANIGVYSIAAALAGARVTAIDASPENCKLIMLNAMLNGVEIRALPLAVSSAFGMELYGRVNQSNKGIAPHAKLALETYDKFEAAFSAPIDAIVGDDRIDIVKIDIDGREFAVLEKAERLFAQRPTFFMEYARDLAMPLSGVHPLELLKLFSQRGYSMTIIGLRGPSINVGSDIEEVDRIARREWEEVNSACIDLLLQSST